MSDNSSSILKNQDAAVQQTQPTPAAGASAPKEVSVKGMNNILDALQAKGLIDAEQVKTVKLLSASTGQPFEEVIQEKAMVDGKTVVRTESEMKGVGFIDIANVEIPQDALNLLSQKIASDTVAIVFEDLGSKVKVAMRDPLDLQKIKYLESFIGKRVEAYYAVPNDILAIIDTRYGAQIGSEVDEALMEVGDQKLQTRYEATEGAGEDPEDAPIIKIVNMIMDYAIKNKSSDVHIEPRDTKVSVRFRVRGVLAEKLSFPQKLANAVITRIKILSDLKIDEHRIPQDGRFQIKSGSSSTDVRVSIMPSIYGEKIVMRILEKSKGILDLDKTGMAGVSYKRMTDALSRTQGIILVTGPTGSGKTQTLASSLKILNTPQVNIVTLEDPVEIRIEGVNQTQVNPEVGLTFASGLRSILRQDPDVIMVGEIRDSETATLAVQSALVGRLVLSTIHTNSAAGAFVRLIDMGIEPFLLTSTVNIIVGQRLVRTLADSKKPYQAPAEMVQKFHEVLDPLGGVTITHPDGSAIEFNQNTQNVTLYEPVPKPGAESGYDSRIGIFEALKMSENIAKLIIGKASISDIEEAAVKEGMLTMLQDGFIKALQGITTIEEVLRVRNE